MRHPVARQKATALPSGETAGSASPGSVGRPRQLPALAPICRHLPQLAWPIGRGHHLGHQGPAIPRPGRRADPRPGSRQDARWSAQGRDHLQRARFVRCDVQVRDPASVGRPDRDIVLTALRGQPQRLAGSRLHDVNVKTILSFAVPEESHLAAIGRPACGPFHSRKTGQWNRH